MIQAMGTIPSQQPELVGKLPCCNYCILEILLNPDLRRAENLEAEPGFEKEFQIQFRAHRDRIEQICQNCNHDCMLKKIALRTYDDRYLLQMKCIEILKLDRSKKLDKEITWEQAVRIWYEEKLDDKRTCAERFSKIWKYILPNLTAIGAYKIIITTAENYQNWIKQFQLLQKEEEDRKEHGR